MMRSGWAALAAVCLVASTADGGPKPAAAEPAKPKDAAADINTPRAEAKHVAFETTEGTWMSVDVSPDGTTIVFDMLGDLYTVPIAGGAATALTKGPAFDYHPRYSPDGKTIAFTSDENGMENLWLIDADGKNRRALTTEKTAYVRSAAWLPGGEYLVARKEDGKRAGIPPDRVVALPSPRRQRHQADVLRRFEQRRRPGRLARRAFHLLLRA